MKIGYYPGYKIGHYKNNLRKHYDNNCKTKIGYDHCSITNNYWIGHTIVQLNEDELKQLKFVHYFMIIFKKKNKI